MQRVLSELVGVVRKGLRVDVALGEHVRVGFAIAAGLMRAGCTTVDYFHRGL